MKNVEIGATFDDYLVQPAFSLIESRKDVSVKSNFLGLEVFPLLNSNMDTIASPEMAAALSKAGCLPTLHRFNTIVENVIQYCLSVDKIIQSGSSNYPVISVGIGGSEVERALALYDVGAKRFLIDVAHGAAIHVVKQYDRLRELLPEDAYIVVGNFADALGIEMFNYHSQSKRKPDAFKVGIGGGSMCLTRIVTGCGVPTLGSVADCARSGYPIIADGGIRNSGDIAKAFAAGASAVMVGQLLAGTLETPGEVLDEFQLNPQSRFYAVDNNYVAKKYKRYRGSASAESYEVQGKTASHRASEGDSTLIPYKGPVSPVLEKLEAGVRSAMTYVGASNLDEFRELARFIKVSSNSVLENSAHGKKS